MRQRKGFTLIELLIVVAIIGILAAIAVPNFLNARTRARVAKVESDQRTISTALESYYLDNNLYPVWVTFEGVNIHPVSRRLNPLTTPISYMATVPWDEFMKSYNGLPIISQPHPAYDSYNYGDAWTVYNTLNGTSLSPDWRCSVWRIESAGPDGSMDAAGIPNYHSSNGLISPGDIQRRGARVDKPCDKSLIGK